MWNKTKVLIRFSALPWNCHRFSSLLTMAVRKAKERKRVIQQGAQKKKKVRKHSGKNLIAKLEALFPIKYRKLAYKATESCFNFLGYCCCKFCFVPLSVDTGGKYKIKQSSWQLVVHYSLLVSLCLRVVQQFVGVAILSAEGELDLTMVLCVISFLTHATGLCLSVSLLFKPYATIHLLNKLPTIMELFHKNGRIVGPLHNPKSVIIVVALVSTASTYVLILPVFSFIVESLPVSLYHLFNKTGIPSFYPGVSPVVWKLVFCPVEIVLVVQSMMLAGWACVYTFVLINVANTCNEHLRHMPTGSLDDWTVLRRRYTVFQVFFKLCNSWIRFMVVPTLTSFGACIVINLYVPLRQHNLPLMLYLCFPIVGFTELFFVFWYTFQFIYITQESEEVVGVMLKSSQDNSAKLNMEQRLYQKKVGRATRALAFDFGDFMEIGIDVPIGMGDEIINQLLFLLSF